MSAFVPDIGIVIFAADQGHFLSRTILAVNRSVTMLTENGMTSSVTVVVRGSDEATATWLNEKCEHRIVHAGEASLGEARNLAVANVHGRHLAFIDGCDLWSANFPSAALLLAKKHRLRVVWRPAVSIGFPDNYFDGGLYSRRHIPGPDLLQPSSLLLANPYPSIFVAERQLLDSMPFPVEDVKRGWTAVDWWWCANLAGAGIHQIPVPDTIHYFRRQRNKQAPAEGRIGPTSLEKRRHSRTFPA